MDGHSSARRVAAAILLPTRAACPRRTCDPAARSPYLALLPVGLAVPPSLPTTRWSLTPPFHPCLSPGGLFSAALSLGLPRPGVTRHRCLVESGLSSRESPARPSGRPRPDSTNGRAICSQSRQLPGSCIVSRLVRLPIPVTRPGNCLPGSSSPPCPTDQAGHSPTAGTWT